MAMKCPKCGRSVANGVEVCPSCGTIVVSEKAKKVRKIAIAAICLGIGALVFNGAALIVSRAVPIPSPVPILILAVLGILCALGGCGCGIVSFVTGLVKKSAPTWVLGLLSFLLGCTGIALGIVNLLIAVLSYSGIYSSLI